MHVIRERAHFNDQTRYDAFNDPDSLLATLLYMY